jgi:hypothetical protein
MQYNEDGSLNEYYLEMYLVEGNEFKSLGQPLEYEEAPEPSDIIWHNIEWKNW